MSLKFTDVFNILNENYGTGEESMRGDDVLESLRNFNEDDNVIHPSVDFNDLELFSVSLQGELIDFKSSSCPSPIFSSKTDCETDEEFVNNDSIEVP